MTLSKLDNLSDAEVHLAVAQTFVVEWMEDWDEHDEDLLGEVLARLHTAVEAVLGEDDYWDYIELDVDAQLDFVDDYLSAAMAA